MNGLKYILFITDTTLKEISEMLQVSHQFVTACSNGVKKLPEKHAKTLQNHFRIPSIYFTKSLTLKEKMYVDLLLQEKETGLAAINDFFHEYVEENTKLKQYIKQLKERKQEC